jgi:hypothetical protein
MKLKIINISIDNAHKRSITAALNKQRILAVLVGGLLQRTIGCKNVN